MTRLLANLIGVVLTLAGLARAGELPPDFAEMSRVLCDSTPTKDGCTKCPAYMSATMLGELKFDDYVAGSFTAVYADEILLRSRMTCYGHVNGFSSAVLLRKISGAWKRITFYHSENKMLLTGDCKKIPGHGRQKDLLLCEFSDWGNGSVAVISLDSNGDIASKQELATEWMIPWREIEPKICSTQLAKLNKISSDTIDILIQTQTYAPSPNCDLDEKNHKFEKFVAQFNRTGDRFNPTAATRDFLERHRKKPD